MTVDDWVLEAVGYVGKHGATVREIQKFIDEHHYEELAIDTLEKSLEGLSTKEKLEEKEGRWYALKKVSKEDAMKKLFGDG